jgi:ABC-2 type transport system ATP-binding protein
MSHAPLAALAGVRKKFGAVQALDGFDLEVKSGETLALLGPNGAGKTTAIAMLLGLQRPDSGTAQLFGSDPIEIAARRRIGVMMQEVALTPVLEAREHIAQTASYYANPLPVDEVIEKLSLQSLARRRYGKLSGGQKRQVQFAMAVCGRPELVFLDEPTVGLDIQARESLWNVVRQLVKDGVSIVLTTHYLEEAEALADRVAVMARGKLIAHGSVEDIRSHVSRKRVSFVSTLAESSIRAWPGVSQFQLDAGRWSLTTQDAEGVLRHLLAADAGVRDIEVQRAGLAEAFAELTGESH